MSGEVEVSVVYALRLRAENVRLRLPTGATVEEAIRQSGMLERFPEIDLGRSRVGIYGRWVRLDAAVRDGDRVEIYRPLTADPKEVRRLRARRRATGI
jgi:putative ubiquitin-RnfH superfamily antitoxin RatB of RatAB toxin-antitoxin module